MEPVFFETPAAFRAWLRKNHKRANELWVGFYKKGSGKPSITWPESVDQALCFGWIDGLRKSLGEESYMIRFSPRKRDSIWSAVNTKRAQELIDEGLMQQAGLAVFNSRNEEKTNRYSFERKNVSFEPAQEKQFKANRKAWDYFQSQAPSYRKAATWWVISAKREETRQKRLATLIADSAAAQRIASMRPAR